MVGKKILEKISSPLEEYLEALWVLQVDEKRKAVKTGELAKYLKNKPASVTEVLSKLKRMGLVEYTPYYGVTLSEKGAKEASLAVRRHRLAEKLMVDVLGLPEGDYEDAACGFEHYVTPKIARKICTLLRHPKTCPHGKAIPKGECCPA